MRAKLTFIFLVFFITACQKDKECVPPPLAEHIVNSWNAKLVSEKDKSQELKFESDGTLKESKGLIFGAAGKPICTWEVENGFVILIGRFTNGNIERYECAVANRTCDQIVLEIEGVDQIELNKK
ncbi:MAG: hypothetical protein J7619_18615 [Dyadobacter sp.]|uniref:hypothetical protein n=1 Tax=Dyadobacter sp. TaxID=1914288 RepID=UPI001B11971A|nr:hypothetical protein [Dyadobacter sp.]MBO9614721.1 hypothetical protein [Dyadobacter sp.]